MVYFNPIKVFFAPVLIPADQDRLVKFLTSEEWPFHVNSRLSQDKVLEMIGIPQESWTALSGGLII